MAVSGGAKLAIAETCQSTNSTNDNGYTFASSKYVTSVLLGGTCAAPTVTALSANTGGSATTFLFTGNYAVNTGRIDWACTSTGAASIAQIPQECR
ncbi:MAG: hypothetical protein L3J22_00325 [Xanthomonadales bacterium]|nr:hypothetical protein [Xanthomonadales bacterium]